MVDSVQRSHIGNTVRVEENQSELIRIKDFVLARLKMTLRTKCQSLAIFLTNFLRKVIGVLTLALLCKCIFGFPVQDFEVVLLHFTSAKLLKHNHLIFTILRRSGQQLLFLRLLSQVNYRGPVLLIFCFERF